MLQAKQTPHHAKKFAKPLYTSRPWWASVLLRLALLPLLWLPLSHAKAQTESLSPNQFGTEHANPRRKRARPNILVIVADDMGAADIGPYGGEVSTPTLDSLARNGITFNNFHTHASCSPTRCA